MFIPYSLWQEVYYFETWDYANIKKWEILEVKIHKEWVFILLSWSVISKRIENIYPNKNDIKEKLLQMAIWQVAKELELI